MLCTSYNSNVLIVMDSVMIIGSAGSVGHDMMYQIASMGLPIKVIGSDVNEVKGNFEIEESLHIAHSFGFYPDLRFERIDLFDIEGTAEKLKELQPKVICNLASLGSWWVTRLLPDEEYKKIGPIGPWLPNHLTLAMKLMEAIKKSGVDIKVVNGAFPDATNVVLGGLNPASGDLIKTLGSFNTFDPDLGWVGDLDTLEPEVREWEPREALTAGPEGLDILLPLVGGVRAFLHSGGFFATEVGENQGEIVAGALMETGGFREVEVRRDLSGRERVVCGVASE